MSRTTFANRFFTALLFRCGASVCARKELSAPTTFHKARWAGARVGGRLWA